jgi:phage/plasmid-like protein (TIGR03299 family)
VSRIESMAYNGLPPWHGLGVRVPPDLTPKQMQKAAGLDWTVEKIPLSYTYNSKKIIVPHEFALIRSSKDETKDGTYLSTVSKNWEPVQNSEIAEFFHEFVMAGNLEMHTAGSLKNGQIVWMLAKVKAGGFKMFGKDIVEPYFLVSSPHVYGKGISFQFTPIREICWNTLALSLTKAENTILTLDHRAKFDAEKVTEMLNLASLKMGKYRERAQFLGAHQFNEESVTSYFAEVFPFSTNNRLKKEMSRPAQNALASLETQPGAEYGKGTWWQAFNAITFNLDHIDGRNPDTRMQSSWYGKAKGQKLFALEKALKYAEAS